MEFQNDQKVVCIKRGPWRNPFGEGPLPGPVYGEVCTVFQCVRFTSFDDAVDDSMFDLILVEYRYDEWHHQIYYASRHFRPVAERKTDISTFTEILDTSRAKETA